MNLPFTSKVVQHPVTDELKQLEESCHRNLGVFVQDLRIKSVDGGLVLEGRAKTDSHKDFVQQVVMNATKLPVVSNRIALG